MTSYPQDTSHDIFKETACIEAISIRINDLYTADPNRTVPVFSKYFDQEIFSVTKRALKEANARKPPEKWYRLDTLADDLRQSYLANAKNSVEECVRLMNKAHDACGRMPGTAARGHCWEKNMASVYEYLERMLHQNEKK